MLGDFLGTMIESGLNRLVKMGCCYTKLPISYLGILLGANYRWKKLWDHIIKRIQEWLIVWKFKLLSKAGRVQLIKSALNSLPIYYLSIFKFPESVAQRISSLPSSFFRVEMTKLESWQMFLGMSLNYPRILGDWALET